MSNSKQCYKISLLDSFGNLTLLRATLSQQWFFHGIYKFWSLWNRFNYLTIVRDMSDTHKAVFLTRSISTSIIFNFLIFKTLGCVFDIRPLSLTKNYTSTVQQETCQIPLNINLVQLLSLFHLTSSWTQQFSVL